jgi:hypothetical protein
MQNLEEIKELAIKRFDICMECPSKTTFLKVDRCKECGCILLAKVIIPNVKCPLGKW